MSVTNMRENIKKVIGVEDDMQDDVLDILMSNVQSHLLGLFKKVDKEIVGIPSEAEYIIFEITVRRYNRIGSEGLKSELVEGHRIDFYDLKDEFDPYLDIIEGYKKDEDHRGDRKSTRLNSSHVAIS